MSGYAILGWGSLIWDLEILAGQVAGPWAMGAGPRLAMEFSRVSPKRKMGLAVCLDPAHGAHCPTSAIRSTRQRVAAVIDDLAARERAPHHHIGAVCRRTGLRQSAQDGVVDMIAEWCHAEGWVGAVWTDLPSNFQDHLGQAFSVDRAVRYLSGLAGENLAEAVRYIESAPAETDTPLRRALDAAAWWQDEAARLGLR